MIPFSVYNVIDVPESCKVLISVRCMILTYNILISLDKIKSGKLLPTIFQWLVVLLKHIRHLHNVLISIDN